MKKLIASLAVVFGILGYGTLQAYNSYNTLDTVKHMRDTVKVISSEQGSGSAVIIAKNRVLTAAHVAEIPNLKINGKPVKILKIDHDLDIAVLEADVDCPCAPLAKGSTIDEKAIAIGFPMFDNVKVQVRTEGLVQGLRTDDEGHLVITSPIAPGNSGGAVFNDKGELIGISIGIFVLPAMFIPEPKLVHYLAVAVDIRAVKKFLEGVDGV